jgi:DHA1 family bicyclomycin/chloramphenicol resistance-like MFS transporter
VTDRSEAIDASSHRYWILLLGAIIALGPLSIDAYLPSLPSIQRDLATTTSAVQLTIASYFVGLAASQLLWGLISDRFGRRRPLLVGLLLYGGGSFVCALAPDIHVLIAARVLQALGGAAGVVIVRAVVRDLWSGRDIARVMSLLILVMGVAPVVAPSLGGAVLAAFGWRAIFYMLGIAAALLFALVAVSLRETRPDRAGAEKPLRAGLGVVTDRVFLSFALAGSFAMAGVFCYIAGAPFVFIEIYGLSPAAFAVLFGVNAAGFVAASQINRVMLRTRDHVGVGRAAMVFTLVVGVGVAWAGWAVAPLWVLLPLLFLYMSSIGFTLPNTTAAAMDPHGARAGMASAVLGTMQYGTAALASAATGAFADSTARPMATAMLATAAVAVLCGFIAPR